MCACVRACVCVCACVGVCECKPECIWACSRICVWTRVFHANLFVNLSLLCMLFLVIMCAVGSVRGCRSVGGDVGEWPVCCVHACTCSYLGVTHSVSMNVCVGGCGCLWVCICECVCVCV